MVSKDDDETCIFVRWSIVHIFGCIEFVGVFVLDTEAG